MPGQARGRGRGKGRKSSKRPNRGRLTAVQTAATSLSYAGPIRPAGTANADAVTVTRLTTIVTTGANASGQLIGTFPNVPNGAGDWTYFSVLFRQYRVLAFKVTWVPFDEGFASNSGTSANFQRPMVTWNVRYPSAPTPASLDAAWDDDSAIVRNIGKQFTQTLRMSGSPDSDWQQCNAPLATNSIGYYAEGLTPSATYGTWFIEHLVQFRSRL